MVTDITGTLPSVTLLKNAETRMVTDVTGTLPSVTPLKNAETCMVTDVTALQGKSSQYEKTCNLKAVYTTLTDIMDISDSIK